MKRLLTLLLLLAPSVLAQNPTSGGPIPSTTYTTLPNNLGVPNGTTVSGSNITFPGNVTGSAGSFTSINNVVMVDTQVGADFCAKLIAALTSVGNNNAYIDARGFTTTQTCSTNPFVNLAGGDSNLVIMMPCTAILTSAPWVIPVTNDVLIIGCGKNGSSVLKAAAGTAFPASTPLLTVGVTGSQVASVMIRDWRLDISTSTSVDLQAYSAIGINEHSGLNGVAIIGQNSAGLTVPLAQIGDIGAASYSAHYIIHDVDLNLSGANDLLLINTDGSSQPEISRITCNNTGSNTGLACIHFQDTFGGGGHFQYASADHVHAEGVTDTVEYEVATGEVNIADCTGTCTNVLHVISGAVNPGGITGIDLSGPSATNIVLDAVQSITLPASSDTKITRYASSRGGGNQEYLTNAYDFVKFLRIGGGGTLNNFGNELFGLNGRLARSSTAPTISSGFGSSPSIVTNSGTSAFTVNVGTGGTATSGVIGMPAASNAYICNVKDLTALAANKTYQTVQTAGTTTTVTVQNQTVGVAPVSSTTAVTSSNPTINNDQQLIELSLPAGFLNISKMPYAIQGSGIYSSTAASSPALTYEVLLCTISGCGSGTVLHLFDITTGTLNTTALTNATWNLNGQCSINTTGATGNLICHGMPGLTLDVGALLSSPATTYEDTNIAVTGNIDLTAALFLDFTIAQSVVGASNSYTQQQGMISPMGSSAGAATPWAASDVLNITCMAY